jgi:signal transduction histidine kinase
MDNRKQEVTPMISHEQGVPLVELLFKESGMYLPELAEDPEKLEDMLQDIFDDLQSSKVQMLGQISALQARNRDLEEYVHMVTHDLREPLAVLAITSKLVINASKYNNGNFQEYVQQMGITAQEMKKIINNLLQFAQMSRAEAPVGPVDMGEIVTNVQDRLSHLIRKQQAKIVLPEMWPLAIGYGPWIEEVWANYLSNALKYGGRPPYLELGASTLPEGVVRFWVRDNGPGISPSVHTRLFAAFDQFSHANIPEHGLGLSIASRIVEKLGGQVGIESKIGAGSLFFFTLPAVSSSHDQRNLVPSRANAAMEIPYSI